MEGKIWPRGPKEKGGYAMMPMRKNIPVGRDGWELTQCPACGCKPERVKEKPEEKASKRIDVGKIMALKRARWTDEDIAAEMRMEPAAVSKVIRQYIRRLAEGGL